MKAIFQTLIIVIGFFLPASSCLFASEILQGEVIKVIDGDSIVVRTAGGRKEIRLWGIDCPEYDQPHAGTAKKRTANLLANDITIEVKGRDSYNRILAIAYSDSVCVNRELVRQGAAWVYDYYCRESVCREWNRLERQARAKRKGLWRDKEPTPPWEWRRTRG